MLKAIVFDFDGVIVDTESQWYFIYKNWMKRDYGYDLKLEDYLVCVGADSKSLFRFLKKEVDEDIDGEEFEKIATKEFIERSSKLPPMQGVIALIEEAKKRGLKIALATSATRKKPETHLKRLGLISYFDALSTAELSEHIKPEPDIFLKAAELIGVEPAECLAIEDSVNGLISAKRAGMPCLVVPNAVTKVGDFEGCYRMVDSLEEVKLDEIEEDFRRGRI